jgi:predicted small lipoprotein YifL
MLKTLHILLAWAACAFIISTGLLGCGTKGPLYIPEQRYPQNESSQQPTPQDESIKANPEANTNATP